MFNPFQKKVAPPPEGNVEPVSQFMGMALDEARKNLSTMEGGPFGACLVKNGQPLVCTHHTDINQDITCHAEINAIRQAAAALGNSDLAGCILYVTSEPCPMCFSAIHSANINAVVFGTTLLDAQKRGFHTLDISSEKMKLLGRSQVKIVGNFLFPQCLEVLELWDRLDNQ